MIIPIEFQNWLEPLLNSLIQGIYTALFGIPLGFLLFLSIRSFTVIANKVALFILIPFLMPSLYILASYYAVGLSAFRGNLSVGLIQGYVISGYVAHVMWKSYQQNWIKFEEVSLIFGVSRFKHWANMLALFKTEFKEFISLSMLLGLTSFSIPLALGGVQGENLEIFIYQKLRLGAEALELWALIFFQIAIFVVLEMIKNKKVSRSDPTFFSSVTNPGLKTFSFSILKLAPLAYLGVLVLPLVAGFFRGILSLYEMGDRIVLLLEATKNSLLIASLLFGVLSFMLLFISYLYLTDSKLILSYFFFPLSASVLAVIFWKMSWIPSLVALILTYTITMLPFLLRFGIMSQLNALDKQILISHIFGQSKLKTWLYILYPQIKGQVFLLSAIGSIWSLMDFAIIKLFISESNYSLGMTAHNWLSSYRYYEAQGLILILMLMSAVILGGVYFAFNRNP
jgi:ABC-type Fe3+ transport system permease subunit